MDWTQIFALIAANLGIVVPLFLYSMSQAAEDRRQMLGLLKGIQDEMKDFHGRLCTIEQRIKNSGI